MRRVGTLNRLAAAKSERTRVARSPTYGRGGRAYVDRELVTASLTRRAARRRTPLPVQERGVGGSGWARTPRSKHDNIIITHTF